MGFFYHPPPDPPSFRTLHIAYILIYIQFTVYAFKSLLCAEHVFFSQDGRVYYEAILI